MQRHIKGEIMKREGEIWDEEMGRGAGCAMNLIILCFFNKILILRWYFVFSL